VGCDAARGPVGPALILRVKGEGRIFLRNDNTHRQVNTASHLSTEVLENSVLAHSVYRKSDPLSELKAFLFLAVCRVALLKRMFYLILSVLQGVSFIMSRDNCLVQGHVEGHTHLCHTPSLLQTLTMLPPVGETSAHTAPVSKAHM
jgi:hypothetical protein